MTKLRRPETAKHAPKEVDALVIGLGISGIYQLSVLKEAGLKVHAFEAGSGVGGTWFWNRYPGARFDSESYLYGYFSSKSLYERWQWSEEFATQTEVEAYLNEAVCEFGLADSMTLNTKVTSMKFDDAEGVWIVRTNTGERVKARFVVSAVGFLSVPLMPSIPGLADFAGEIHHTGMWPGEGVELADKRVGVVGVASSGVQFATEVAPVVDELVVFQRTPNWVTPLHNKPIDENRAKEIRDSYEEYHRRTTNSSFGFLEVNLSEPGDFAKHTPEQRREMFEKVLALQGFGKFFSNYPEVGIPGEANEAWCSFLAEKIRERVVDQEVAERLIPDHPYGSKRPPFDSGSGYYEIFNRPNVELVSVRETPIVRVTETGIETTERHIELDVIALATGFKAVTGAFDEIDIEAYGQKLKDRWAEDAPKTYLSVHTPGFPNFFHAFGPLTSGGNAPRSAEIMSDFIVDIICEGTKRNVKTIDTPPEAAESWFQTVIDSSRGSVLGEGDSWMRMANIPGKKPLPYMFYLGGLAAHKQIFDESKANSFTDFIFD